MLFQLVQYGSLFRKAFPAGVGLAKNLAFRLLETWRNARFSLTDLQRMLSAPSQFYPSCRADRLG